MMFERKLVLSADLDLERYALCDPTHGQQDKFNFIME